MKGWSQRGGGGCGGGGGGGGKHMEQPATTPAIASYHPYLQTHLTDHLFPLDASEYFAADMFLVCRA